MTRFERVLLFRTFLLGIVLTIVVIVLDRVDAFRSLERWTYDTRAKHFQYFTPKPTDRILHVDIDDSTLQSVGAWPWSRTVIADMIDELHMAGAKVIAMDILFSEPKPTRLVREVNESVTEVDEDGEFAAAIRRAGCVLVPSKFNFAETAAKASAQEIAIAKALENDCEASIEQANAVLAKQGVKAADSDLFFDAREHALAVRVEKAMAGGQRSLYELREMILPHSTGSGALPRLLAREYQQYVAEQEAKRLTVPIRPGNIAPLGSGASVLTISKLAAAAQYTAFVDYLQEPDGVVRGVPLFIQHNGRLVPQMGLALACAQLDADLSRAVLARDQVTIPANGRLITIPVHTYQSEAYGDVTLYMDIPWFGTRDWKTMYDYPARRVIAQHLPAVEIWEISQRRAGVAKNNVAADQALQALLSTTDPDKLAEYQKHVPDLHDATVRQPIIDATLKDIVPFLEQYKSIKPDELTAEDRAFMSAADALDRVAVANRDLTSQINALRSSLHQHANGRAVLIGWTAAGAMDTVPTSIHAKCPGVVVHGVVFNAIVTGQMWQMGAWWTVALITGVIGLLTTGIVAWLSPWKALMCTAAVIGGYTLLNCFVRFDYGNSIVGLAAPLVASVAVWSALTLSRFITEITERARIKKRFQKYVDPKLVNHLLDNPHKSGMEGELREMTVIFTDLAGFTTISEKLQEAAVPLLNEYLSLMVPVINKREGFINRFMGDGILFFFGAPMDCPDHAVRAVATGLDMQIAMISFNKELVERGHQPLAVRVGVSTGMMIVGDAGGADFAEYTVLGDCVNLGARLESANKATGTKGLVSGRTEELAREHFLFRPIASLQVKGKTRGVMTFEPIAPIAEATDEQHRYVAMTKTAFDAFQNRAFAECIVALNELDAAFGDSKLSKTYRQMCEEYLVECPKDFDGQIVLSEK